MFCRKCGGHINEETMECEVCGCKYESDTYSRDVLSEPVEPIEKEISQETPKKTKPDRPSPSGPSKIFILLGCMAALWLAVVITAIVFVHSWVSENKMQEQQDKDMQGTQEEVTDNIIVDEVVSQEETEDTDIIDAEIEEEEAVADEVVEEQSSTPDPTPTPTPTLIPTAAPYPVSAITSFVTDAEPGDLGSFKRPTFTYANASSYLVQELHPDYDNSARSIIDGDYITSWQDGAPGDGTGQQIVIELEDKKLIHYLEFKLGNWRSTEYYYKNARPKQMNLEVEGTEFRLDFTDAIISHYVDFSHPVYAKTLSFTISSVYKGTETEDCCIAEITAYTE